MAAAATWRTSVSPPVSPSLGAQAQPEENVSMWASMMRRGFARSVSGAASNFPESESAWRSEGDDLNDSGPADGQKQPAQGMFMDSAAMKEMIRKNLLKEEYNVAKFYHETGVWRDIATSPHFEKITLIVIAVNAIWIGVDTDNNSAEVLLQAHWTFQTAEHLFCFFFSFEWFSRFMSFKLKRMGLKDGWFVFDSVLVFMMVMETWFLTGMMLVAGSSGGSGLGNASILRMARLARLTRMARMARLLRAMPELMILIKGIVAATRSVFFTLCLLCLLLYIFGIAFTQLLVDTPVGKEMFPDVAASMYTLLTSGTLGGGPGHALEVLGKEKPYFAALYLLFLLLASITVMNLLIGVLCEVVSTVAAVEKETMIVNFVKNRLHEVLEELDEDGSGTISKDEFMAVLEQPEACQALNECGVDVEGIYEFADFIFDDEDNGQSKELPFEDFMQVVLQFRGSNNATVKDIVDLRKYVKTRISQNTSDLRELRELIDSCFSEEDAAHQAHRKHRGGRFEGGDHDEVWHHRAAKDKLWLLDSPAPPDVSSLDLHAQALDLPPSNAEEVAPRAFGWDLPGSLEEPVLPVWLPRPPTEVPEPFLLPERLRSAEEASEVFDHDPSAVHATETPSFPAESPVGEPQRLPPTSLAPALMSPPAQPTAIEVATPRRAQAPEPPTAKIATPCWSLGPPPLGPAMPPLSPSCAATTLPTGPTTAEDGGAGDGAASAHGSPTVAGRWSVEPPALDAPAAPAAEAPASAPAAALAAALERLTAEAAPAPLAAWRAGAALPEAAPAPPPAAPVAPPEAAVADPPLAMPLPQLLLPAPAPPDSDQVPHMRLAPRPRR